MKEGFLKYGDYNLHHVRWGEKGHKVLLIHSMGMDGHSMDALAENLKEEYQVLSLTILNHGDSDPPKGSISLPDHAEVMRGCYTQLGFSPSVLVGHSVGGMMGMVLAAEHPDEFEGLVLVDIAPFDFTRYSPRPQPPDSFKDEAEALDWLKERYPSFTPYYYENRLKYAFRKEDGVLRLKPRGDKIRGGLATDLWPYVERIKAPTLLLIGEESDLVTPETQERMENTVPDIEAIKVKGTGHMIPQNRPKEFEKLVKAYLERVF
jgi:pimeloyl-ACP methyl ester carboxylesterase